MTTPIDSSGTTPGELQFDQAEYTGEKDTAEANATPCNACGSAISDVYFECGGKILCASCRERIVALFNQGSRLGRGIKALVFGTVGAAIGAFLYYVIIRVTGLNLSLVAIVLGVMVGGAVKAGSGSRGGRFYQVLAVFLTYSAIASMYLPGLVELVQQAGHHVPAEAGAKLETREVTDGQKKGEAGKNDQAPAKGTGQVALRPEGAQRRRGLAQALGLLVTALALFVAIAYAAPVLASIQSPITGLIFAFALWEAWKINRKVHLAFAGPFRLETRHGGDEPRRTAEEPGHES
jgi:hypothetical protein